MSQKFQRRQQQYKQYCTLLIWMPIAAIWRINDAKIPSTNKPSVVGVCVCRPIRVVCGVCVGVTEQSTVAMAQPWSIIVSGFRGEWKTCHGLMGSRQCTAGTEWSHTLQLSSCNCV